MDWRVARSLDVLLDQLNTLAPNRNKASDGSIGDTNHQNRTSDHNPWYGPGIVTARDFTHDPAGGLDCSTLANTLVAHRDPRVKYIIFNRRILSGNPGPSPWVWRAYSGPNPHTKHLHLSVVASPACDSSAPWAGIIPQPPEVRDMDLNDSLAPYTWDKRPVPGAEVVGAALMNINNRVVRLETAVAGVFAEVTNDPDITQDRMLELMEQAAEKALRENPPAQQPVDLEAIRQAVREAQAEDNEDLADAVVDKVAARLAN